MQRHPLLRFFTVFYGKNSTFLPPLPPIPLAPTVTVQGPNALHLSWVSVIGGAYYEVYRSRLEDPGTSLRLADTHSDSYVDTGRALGTYYHYWLKACNFNDECSDFSPISTVIIPVKPIAPTLAVRSDSSIDLSWFPVIGGEYYEVYRSTQAIGAERTKVGTSTTNLFSDDAGLSASTNYDYWIKACGAIVCSDFSLSSTARTRLSPPLSPTVTVQALSALHVSWGSVIGATYYEVYRSPDAAGNSRTRIATPTLTAYSDASLSSLTTYYYWLKACSDTACSDFSEVASGVTPLVLLGMPTATFTSSLTIHVSWPEVPDAGLYRVFHTTMTAADATFTQIGTSTSTSYVHMLPSHALETETYRYRFQACVNTDLSTCTVHSPIVSLLLLDTDSDGVADFYDVDDDNDGLIEVSSTTQFNQIRHNLAGTSYKSTASSAGNTLGAPTSITTECTGRTAPNNLCGYEIGMNSTPPITISLGAFDPIGSLSAPFTARFHGNGNTLANLSITAPINSSNIGLFACTDDAILADFRLQNFTIETGLTTAGANYVGAVVGRFDNSTLEKVVLLDTNNSQLDVTGYDIVSGLVGWQRGGSIVDVVAIGLNIEARRLAAGLVGLQDSGTMHNVLILDTSVLSQTSSQAGGLIGVQKGTLTDALAGDMTVHAYLNSGGVTGHLYPSGSISRVYSYSQVSITPNSFIGVGAGGLIGKNEGTITNSYWDSQASGEAHGVGNGSATGTTSLTTAQMQSITGTYPVNLGTANFLFTAEQYPRLCYASGTLGTTCTSTELLPQQ